MTYCGEDCTAEKWHEDINRSRYHYCYIHGLIKACDLDSEGHDIGEHIEIKGKQP